MVSFKQKIIFFLFLLDVPHTMLDGFVKYRVGRIFFLLKKKIVLIKQKIFFLRFCNSDE